MLKNNVACLVKFKKCTSSHWGALLLAIRVEPRETVVANGKQHKYSPTGRCQKGCVPATEHDRALRITKPRLCISLLITHKCNIKGINRFRRIYLV